jgi:hypothetical protein
MAAAAGQIVGLIENAWDDSRQPSSYNINPFSSAGADKHLPALSISDPALVLSLPRLRREAGLKDADSDTAIPLIFPEQIAC